MKNEYAKHEIDYIRKLEKMGYTASYKCQDGRLQNLQNQQWYQPEDIQLVEEFRYEGMSNPADSSILYIIEGKDGTKGTILAAYGPEGNSELAWFLKKIPAENKGQFDKQKLIQTLENKQ